MPEINNDDDNLEGVGHPIMPEINDDDEDEFNDAEEITDEMLDPDNLEGVGHPIVLNLSDVTEEPNLPEGQIEVQVEPQAPEKRKHPSTRERRRTRSMAAAGRRALRKEQWMLFREGNWTKP